jgi:hypothetical protein
MDKIACVGALQNLAIVPTKIQPYKLVLNHFEKHNAITLAPHILQLQQADYY